MLEIQNFFDFSRGVIIEQSLLGGIYFSLMCMILNEFYK